jgi:hypothetical protein
VDRDAAASGANSSVHRGFSLKNDSMSVDGVLRARVGKPCGGKGVVGVLMIGTASDAPMFGGAGGLKAAKFTALRLSVIGKCGGGGSTEMLRDCATSIRSAPPGEGGRLLRGGAAEGPGPTRCLVEGVVLMVERCRMEGPKIP